jgi:hypothetical protein
LPNAAGTKPRGANTMPEITNNKETKNKKNSSNKKTLIIVK